MNKSLLSQSLNQCASVCASACLAAVLATAATGAMAAPVDLTTWTGLGDTLVTASTAKVTTAFSDEAPLSGSALYIDDLESGLSATSGTLGGEALEGSALLQSFNFTGNTRVSFNWALSTENFDAGYADLAFVLIDGVLLQPLANVALAEQSGLFRYSFTAGAHTLAFGVVDVNDVTGVSILSVANVDVSLVPEPGSLALLLAGLGLVATQSARRRTLE